MDLVSSWCIVLIKLLKTENHLKTRINARIVLKLDLKEIGHEVLEFLWLMMGSRGGILLAW